MWQKTWIDIPVCCAWFQVLNRVLSFSGVHLNHVTGHVTTRDLDVISSDGLPVTVRSGPCHQEGGGTTAYLHKEYMYWYICIVNVSTPVLHVLTVCTFGSLSFHDWLTLTWDWGGANIFDVHGHWLHQK